MKTILKAAAGTLALGVLAGVVAPNRPAHAATGGAGWQAPYTYTVPTGTPDLFFHYDCPTGFSVQNGGFQGEQHHSGPRFPAQRQRPPAGHLAGQLQRVCLELPLER